MTTTSPISTGLTEASTRPFTPGTSSRLEFIDALRGFACVWVLLCHVQGFWLDGRPTAAAGPVHWADATVSGFCRIGIAGVDLFIVLSGFCLYWPVVRARRRGDEFKPALFFKRRARRIIPAYYAAVIACAGLAFWLGPGSFVARLPRLIDVAAYLGFVMTFVPYWLTTVNGTYWSIALEAQLYVCFPLAVWLSRWYGLRSVVVVAVVVTGSWQLVQCTGLGNRFGISAVAYLYHLPARYFEFVAGMVAADFASAPRRGQGRIGLAAALVALPVALLCAKYEITTWSEVMYSAWGVVFAGLILFLAELPAEWFTRPTRAGLLTRVGIVSYSLYLIHAPILILTTRYVQRAASRLHAGPVTVVALFLLVGVPLLTSAAYGCYLVFEKPFMNPAKRPGPLLSPNPDAPHAAPAGTA
jgi:peptidoglycan/LPS O-acetylase OafA/YrhL